MVCHMSVICHLPRTLIEICEIKLDLVRWDIYPAQATQAAHNAIERNRIRVGKKSLTKTEKFLQVQSRIYTTQAHTMTNFFPSQMLPLCRIRFELLSIIFSSIHTNPKCTIEIQRETLPMHELGFILWHFAIALLCVIHNVDAEYMWNID